jgi:glycopeptide antibiotics resistance protein
MRSFDETRGVRIGTIALVLLVVYLVVLALLTFVPGTEDTTRNVRVNTRPLGSILPALRLGPGSFSYRQLIGNVVAFVPLGVLLPLVLSRPRWSAAIVFVSAIALSAAIELGQLAVSLHLGYGYRAADIDDVILNTFGAMLGYGAFAIVSWLAQAQSGGT